jgi:hypothetical protein
MSGDFALLSGRSGGQGNIPSARRRLLMWLARCMQSMAALSLPIRICLAALSVRVLLLPDCYAALPPLSAVMLNSLQ